MTKSERMRDNAVMISSTMPSAKYSCSGSPLMFSNGKTAIDGLSGKGSGAVAGGPIVSWPIFRSKTRIGRHIGIAQGHLALNLDGAAHGVDDAAELNQ